MILVLDVHQAQKTEVILDKLSTPIYIPSGTTGLIQPLDIAVNATFKAIVKETEDQHIQDHLQRIGECFSRNGLVKHGSRSRGGRM